MNPPVQVLITDENRYAISEDLKALNKYIIVETKAPTNYEYNDKLEMPVFIEKQNLLIQIYVNNEKIEEKEFLHTGRNHMIEAVVTGIIIIVIITGTGIVWRKYK